MLALARLLDKSRINACVLSATVAVLPVISLAVLLYVSIKRDLGDIVLVMLCACIWPFYIFISSQAEKSALFVFAVSLMSLVIAILIGQLFRFAQKMDWVLVIAVIASYILLLLVSNIFSYDNLVNVIYNSFAGYDFEVTIEQLSSTLPFLFAFSTSVQLSFGLLFAIYWLYSLNGNTAFAQYFSNIRLSVAMLVLSIIFIALVYFAIESEISKALAILSLKIPIVFIALGLVHWLLKFYNQDKLAIFALLYLAVIVLDTFSYILICLVVADTFIDIRQKLQQKLTDN